MTTGPTLAELLTLMPPVDIPDDARLAVTAGDLRAMLSRLKVASDDHANPSATATKTAALRTEFWHDREDEPFAVGGGFLEVRTGTFASILVAIRDGRESLLPVNLAKVLFGDEAVDALVSR